MRYIQRRFVYISADSFIFSADSFIPSSTRRGAAGGGGVVTGVKTIPALRATPPWKGGD